MDDPNEVGGRLVKINHKKDAKMAKFLFKSRRIPSLMFLASTPFFCACHTMVFINQDAPSQVGWVEPVHYETSVTHHEGMLGWVAGDMLSLDSACGKNNWQVIKTENTLKDALIGLVFNPIYSSSSVSIDCKNQRVAQQ